MAMSLARPSRRMLGPLAGGLGAVLLGGVLALPGRDGPFSARAEGRTVELYLVVRSDLQRQHPGRAADEPIEPSPTLRQRARALVESHPAFRGVTLHVVSDQAAPNPRVPGDFLGLLERRVDEVVVVTLDYHLRLDSFRASGEATIHGHAAVYSVAARRQVLSRVLVATVRYPGTVSREAVLEAEVAARARGSLVPVEQVELELLDRAVKQALEPELRATLGIYHLPSLPQGSPRAVRQSLERMAGFLTGIPERRQEAVAVLERYLRGFAEPTERAALEARLAALRRPGGPEGRRDAERRALRVDRTLRARELAAVVDQLTGRVVEVWDFKLWQVEATVWLRTDDERQDFVLEEVPRSVFELEADPPNLYVRVMGRRPDPRFIDTRIPVLRWVACPRALCP
jgi:hypothetical protein